MTVDQTAVQLRRTILHLARKLNASATDEGLTPSQASTLDLIAARGPLPLAEVARIDSLHPTMVSRIVGVLEGAGLVERAKDPGDQRAFTVAATAAGEALDRRIREQRVAGIVAASRELSPEQRAALDGALSALESLAEAMP